jgi:hypothetical protein
MPHRHPTAILLLFVSYLIVANFAVDTVAGAFPDWLPGRGIKQAVTGA